MSTAKKTVIPLVVAFVIIAVFYYVTIPPINIKSTDFWWFLIWCLVIVGIALIVPRGAHAGFNFFEELKSSGWQNLFKRGKKDKDSEEEEKPKKKRGFVFYYICVIIFLLLGLFVGQVASSAFFNARAYSGLLQVEDGDFANDIAEISVKNVPVVDRDTAERLGNRTLGEIDDLVSQFAIDQSDSAYTQINYKSQPYRVSSLVYADIIKWITNTAQGLPGFVTVNMATQQTELVRLPEGQYMHISTGEHFNNYLYRYVRFQYPFEMLGEAAFELDDNGTPYWIVPTVTMRIGLFGGEDYTGAIFVNPCTGETTRYSLEEVPNWADKIFSAGLVYNQLNYYGKYRSGFWNSIIGQSGVLVPTGSNAPSLFSGGGASGYSAGGNGIYNYLAIDDDVYMYTGMTSANSDESIVGFVLVNLRTKQTSYYTCAGATETSAMDSAEGQVQQMEYNATSPLLLNIADRPTYFLSLKDSAGLVKMYAFIDVQQYQIVGTGSTIDDAQKNYINALASDTQVDLDEEALAGAEQEVPTVKGTVESISPVVADGNTRYYFMLEDDERVYIATVSASAKLPFVKAGDEVEFTCSDDGDVREVGTFK